MVVARSAQASGRPDDRAAPSAATSKVRASVAEPARLHLQSCAAGRVPAPGRPDERDLPRLNTDSPACCSGPTLIWASTWHVILYQIGEVPALNAVAWRFALASALLFCISAWRGESWRPTARLQPWLMLTGTVQFGLNYWASTRPSATSLGPGRGAVLADGVRQRGHRRLVLRPADHTAIRDLGGGGRGRRRADLWPEWCRPARVRSDDRAGHRLGAVACACTGNALTLRLSRQGMPLVPVLAWAWATAP